MKTIICWFVAPYGLVENDRRFRNAYCVYYQDDESTSEGVLHTVGLIT
jgi:hypothetical protein